MLKQNAALEVKIGERVYTLNLPADAPLGEAHDALFQMRSYVVGKILEAQKLDAPKDNEKKEDPEANSV